AFRRLALEYHPDRNPWDPSAAERFRRVVGAYRQVLRQAPIGPPSRRPPVCPLVDFWLSQPYAVWPRRRVSARRLFRWTRAVRGFALAHGRLLPIVTSIILSVLVTAAGLASEGSL
ncbi:MAG: J domain-containing protein, partial [Phycisphaerales bacterium]